MAILASTYLGPKDREILDNLNLSSSIAQDEDEKVVSSQEMVKNMAFYITLIILLCIGIQMTLVQNNFNKLLKIHKIDKKQLRDNFENLPQEVKDKLKKMKRAGVVAVIVIPAWSIIFYFFLK